MTRGALRHQGAIISLDWEGRGLAEWGEADGEAGDTHREGSYLIKTFSTYYHPHSLHNDMRRFCMGGQNGLPKRMIRQKNSYIPKKGKRNNRYVYLDHRAQPQQRINIGLYIYN
jgi:hypothetical protein